MDVVEFRPEPDQYAWTFGGVAPTHGAARHRAAAVDRGRLLRRLRRPTDLPSRSLTMPR